MANTDNRSWFARAADKDAQDAENRADKAEARAGEAPEDAKLAKKAEKARAKAVKERERARSVAEDERKKQDEKAKKQERKQAEKEERQREAERQEAEKRRAIARHGPVYVLPDKLIYSSFLDGYTEKPIAGASASVEESGQLSSRTTLTRSLVPGMHGWQKQQDDRKLWLIVDGVDFRWTVDAGMPAFGDKAVRRFADQLTSAGRAAAAETAPTDSSDEAPPSGDGDVVAKLRELSDLHSRGALTDDEYAAAKSRLLG